MEIYQLGKNPKKADSRNLKLSKYLKLDQLPPIPDSVDYIAQSGITDFGMMVNDRYGDCVWAALGHMIMIQTALNGSLFTPSDDDILQAYALTGFDPSTGSGDNGTNELDAMKYMQSTGIAGHKWGPFVEVDMTNQDEVKAAIFLFGALLAGVELPLSEQGQSEWDNPPADGNSNDQTAGSWGGHGIPVAAFDNSSQKVKIITWGQPMDVDWSFFFGTDENGTPYLGELYAAVSPDWVNDTTLAPNGIDMATLISDLQLVQQ